MEKKCPFYDGRKRDDLTDVQRSLYGDGAGWCEETDGVCAKDFLCPSAKLIKKLSDALTVIKDLAVPEGHVIQRPCTACRQRTRVAKDALKEVKNAKV